MCHRGQRLCSQRQQVLRCNRSQGLHCCCCCCCYCLTCCCCWCCCMPRRQVAASGRAAPSCCPPLLPRQGHQQRWPKGSPPGTTGQCCGRRRGWRGSAPPLHARRGGTTHCYGRALAPCHVWLPLHDCCCLPCLPLLHAPSHLPHPAARSRGWELAAARGGWLQLHFQLLLLPHQTIKLAIFVVYLTRLLLTCVLARRPSKIVIVCRSSVVDTLAQATTVLRC
jgi:hypothetical protein